MTDSDLNEAVARKLGYTKDFDFGWIIPERHKDGFAVGQTTLPDYCHSIQAAWEIVESLTPCHGVFLKQSLQPPYGWTVTMWSPMTEEPDFMVHADTAPRAICLAFLKLP